MKLANSDTTSCRRARRRHRKPSQRSCYDVARRVCIRTIAFGERPRLAVPGYDPAAGVQACAQIDKLHLDSICLPIVIFDNNYNANSFLVEPTNAQILFDRAVNLQESGRVDAARPLFRQLADGAWQPRFSGLKEQARTYLQR